MVIIATDTGLIVHAEHDTNFRPKGIVVSSAGTHTKFRGQ
jgi:hypothetical protein